MNNSNSDPIFKIVPYQPAFRDAFEGLNRAWLEAHSLLEPADLPSLENPELNILSKGGQVFFVIQNNKVIGTCAAICLSNTIFELAKLSVDPAFHGHGLGRRLCEAVINFAYQAGALKVVLSSNSVLTNAINLYESLGFQHSPSPPNIQYKTANIFMTLKLTCIIHKNK